MKKFKLGQRVRVGGRLGMIMTITSIDGQNMVLENGSCIFYYQAGVCSLFPVNEYVQLNLFDGDLA